VKDSRYNERRKITVAIDIRVDNRGDFVLANIRKYPRLRIDWVDSTQPVLRLDFEQAEEVVPMEPSSKQICIDFVSAQDERSLDAKALTVTDMEEVKQRLMVRLRTEYGEMSTKSDFGSYLVTQRHEDIMSTEVQNMIQSIVFSEVADLLDAPKVIVAPKKKDGPFYCQNLSVYVYNDGELIFDIEV
jgi:hypothetical protein